MHRLSDAANAREQQEARKSSISPRSVAISVFGPAIAENLIPEIRNLTKVIPVEADLPEKQATANTRRDSHQLVGPSIKMWLPRSEQGFAVGVDSTLDIR